MRPAEPAEFAELIAREQETLLAEWRRRVRELPSAAGLDIPKLNDHIPLLLEELTAALRAPADHERTLEATLGSSSSHGLQRVEDGFDIGEMVAEYAILRGCVHRLAEQHGLVLCGETFDITHRVLSGAVVFAVEQFAERRALDVQERREEYLAFVAHDLRTPLNAIALAARVIESSFAPEDASPEIGRMFQALRRNVKTLEGLVQKVLEENASLQTELGVKVQRRQLDLWPLVEALTHDLSPVAGTGSTRLVNTVPPDLVAYADASLLRRIFQNLIANAIRYTPQGRIQIGARPQDHEGAVEIWVTDNGRGIAPEALARVFEKGETDALDESSLGLGLSIVKTFVEAHGGEVRAESKLDEGSSFRFTLPAPGG